jgi:hypothetical protein
VRSLLLVCVVACAAAPAEARIVVHHGGRHAWPAGPVPAAWSDQVPPGYEAGYSCETAGLLWTDLAVWDCRPCLIHEEAQTAMSLEGAPADLVSAIAAAYRFSDVRRGLWEAHGRWALLMVVASGVAAFMARRRGEGAGSGASGSGPAVSEGAGDEEQAADAEIQQAASDGPPADR